MSHSEVLKLECFGVYKRWTFHNYEKFLTSIEIKEVSLFECRLAKNSKQMSKVLHLKGIIS